MASPLDPVAPIGDLPGPAGRPPRRASLLDVRFAFGAEGTAVERVPGPQGVTADPTPGAVAAIPPADAEGPSAPQAAAAPVFVTATMAELYRTQGMPERALEIYRTLLARDPGRSDLLERVRALEAAVPGVGTPPAMLAALSFDDVRLPAVEVAPPRLAEPSARAFLRALGERRAGGAVAHDLGAAAAAIGDAPLQAAVALDDAFADWT